jgi:antirestriction protein ArdC
MPKNTTKRSKPAFDVYQAVTDAIIAKLKQGVVPWQKPWKSSEAGSPRNLISKKAYRGINVFLLGMQGYGSPYWLTYKQAAELAYKSWLKLTSQKDSLEAAKAYNKLAICEPGEDFDPLKHKGGVAKGQKSTLITFWKIIPGVDKDTGKKKNIPLLRYFNVFNVEQCRGLDRYLPDPNPIEGVEDETTVTPCEVAEGIVENMPEEMPRPEHHGARAYFMPSTDQVVLPPMEDFKNQTGYYGTLFHELVHATGHKDRLNRPELVKMNGFGSEDYSKEELVAEMGAAMLCATAGLEPDYDNNAAYIGSWLKKLQDDPKLVVQAAGKAQKAADYILGTTFDNDEKEEVTA